MIKTSIETKVGILFFITLVILGLFVYLLSVFNPFTPTFKLKILFNYAGGLSIGSPVRVAGVKVGRVSNIEFITSEDTNRLKIMATLLIRRSIASSIKKDSQFFINMSGLIGEKYIEINPGKDLEATLPGSVLVGIDPPRIDQLISQSYDLFSKMENLIIDNRGNLTRVLTIIENLTTSLNEIFKSTTEKDSENFRKIVSNIQKITFDLQTITSKTHKSIIPILLDLEPTVGNLKKISHNLDIFSQFLSTLNQSDKDNFENAVKNLSDILASLDNIVKQLPDFKLEEFKKIFSDTGVKVRIF